MRFEQVLHEFMERTSDGWKLKAERLDGVRRILETEATVSPEPERAKTLVLHEWQRKALTNWIQADHRGIVEAVTGTGKAFVGLGAIQLALKERPSVKSLVVVPTIPIMHQWCRRLAEFFPKGRIGQIGDGSNDDFSSPHTFAIVAIVNSVVLNDAIRLRRLFPQRGHVAMRSMLIADECHRYLNGTTFSRVLRFPFERTLGLSATVDDHFVPGLGKVICEYGFKAAHEDGLIPPFDLINTEFSLTPRESDDYEELSQRVSGAMSRLRELYPDIFRFDGDALWRRLKQEMGTLGSGKAPAIERLFKLFFKRAAISYKATNKMRAAERLVRHMVAVEGMKVIVFFERIESAEDVDDNIDIRTAQQLHDDLESGETISSLVYHSGMRNDDRREVLESFARGGPSALLACRALDEGLDIPDVDGAVLVASTQSARQRV